MSVSVLILTLNEEVNLQRCLESVSWSDDIIVFDSYSTDRTVEIARDFGARVVQRHFDNERDHRTASLQLQFKYPWVYNPDADEVTPPDLRDEILGVVNNPDLDPVAYSVRFKTMFMGRWLRRSSLYPTWVIRLFRPEKLSFKRSINLNYIVDGVTARLEAHFDHFTFSKGIAEWFMKHNKYSLFEAMETIKELAHGRIDWKAILSRDPKRRRIAMKHLSFRLPFRPLAKFLYMYFARRGFLDGRPGLTYCLLQAIYEAMIVVKVREIRRAKNGLSM